MSIKPTLCRLIEPWNNTDPRSLLHSNPHQFDKIRHQILQLILEHEKTFENLLLKLKQDYVTPMKQSGVLSVTEFQLLFPNELNIIASLNSEVLKGIEIAINGLSE